MMINVIQGKTYKLIGNYFDSNLISFLRIWNMFSWFIAMTTATTTMTTIHIILAFSNQCFDTFTNWSHFLCTMSIWCDNFTYFLDHRFLNVLDQQIRFIDRILFLNLPGLTKMFLYSVYM